MILSALFIFLFDIAISYTITNNELTKRYTNIKAYINNKTDHLIRYASLCVTLSISIIYTVYPSDISIEVCVFFIVLIHAVELWLLCIYRLTNTIINILDILKLLLYITSSLIMLTHTFISPLIILILSFVYCFIAPPVDAII